MSGYGPSQHFAPPHDFGRKPGIAEVDWQPSIAEGDARDPQRTRPAAIRTNRRMSRQSGPSSPVGKNRLRYVKHMIVTQESLSVAIDSPTQRLRS